MGLRLPAPRPCELCRGKAHRSGDASVGGRQLRRWLRSISIPDINVSITNPVGLHARPATLLVQAASRYRDTLVEIVKDGAVRVARVKARLRRLDSRECERAAGDAIGLEDGQQVRDLLTARGLQR
ncbi:MAG: HPr family phosphocarrier protein [Candidatus Dormibacteraceae bacterium]